MYPVTLMIQGARGVRFQFDSWKKLIILVQESRFFFNRFVANRFCFAKNRIQYFLKYITKIIKIFENE